MTEDKWVVQCYAFPNGKEYEKAMKEQETVAYIKANTDLANIKVVAKLYINLIEKKTFDTIVGFTFLEELRNLLLSQNGITEDSLPPIPINSITSKMSKVSVANERAEKYKALYEKSDSKKKLSIYANIFLVIMIIVMMALAIMTKKNANPNETELINKYSKWKQELQQKQDELNQREQELNQLQEEK